MEGKLEAVMGLAELAAWAEALAVEQVGVAGRPTQVRALMSPLMAEVVVEVGSAE